MNDDPYLPFYPGKAQLTQETVAHLHCEWHCASLQQVQLVRHAAAELTRVTVQATTTLPGCAPF